MKKALSVLLCLCLVLSVFSSLPFTASAATLDEATKSVGVKSGTTGDCTWTLSDDGVLTISGNGAMGELTASWTAPWYSIRTSIKTVVIRNGVTSICNYAFYSCYNLINVSIANSVNSIGTGAFGYCSRLKSIYIPYSVTSIGPFAFDACSHLERIVVDSNNPKYDSRNNCNAIIISASNTLRHGCSNTVIPNTVTSIGNRAFYYQKNLTSISIPPSVTSIGSEAFEFCEELSNIEMPNSVQKIGKYAFEFCEKITNMIIPDGVTSIYEKTFYGCSSLLSVIIPKSVTSISNEAFYKCANLKSVTIPESVMYIGEKAFGYDYYDAAEKKVSNFIIRGKNGTVAQNYANTNGFSFIVLQETDTTKPTVSLSSTNNVALSQTVIISLSDNVGIKGYHWGTSSSYSNNTYATTSSTSISKTVNSAGTYYATAVDTSGNVSSTVSITFYKTTLNANGGSVSPSSVLTKSGNSFTFPTPTRSDYTYVGWSTSSTATSGVKTLSPSSNATYYAVWSNADSQKPTVSLSSTNNVAASQTVTISMSDNVGIKGYYWGTSASYSNNTYTTSSSTSVTKTVNSLGTYYVAAVDTSGNISDNKSITFYKTTLKANGGSVSPTSVLTKSGNSFTFPTPTRSNYSYVGWSTSSTATSGVKTLSPTSSLTYYAVWKTNSSFVWGQDNWNYKNSAPTYFPSSTYRNQINNTYLNKLKSNLTNSEYQTVFQGTWYRSAWLDDRWGGSCYGMSSLALLSKDGLLPYSSYQSGATKLHDLGYPKNNSNLNSLITYYQMLQVKDVIQQQYRTVPNKTNQENITNLINLLDKNPTVLVGFKKTGWGGHAILATGYEYGSWTFNGVSYQGCIKICDPNASTSYNTRYNIYFNTKSYNWTIPAYSNMTSTAGAKFNYIGATVIEINKGGYLSGTSGNKVDDFVARIDATAISDNRSVSKVENINGVYMNQSSQPNEIVEDYSFILGNESEGTVGYNLYDANSSYKISQSNAEKLQLYMDYENCSLTGGSAAGESVIFDKSGYVEVNGESAMYNMSMTYDETYPTDWFTIQVQGYNANSASLRMVNDGYVLTADNLENVSLRANNRKTYAQAAFTTEYNSVLIYEIDENTIGLKADTDGNGTYETELPANTFQIGDTDGDGKITISDVTEIQRHLAELIHFTDDQLILADTNGDGKVDIGDATHLQKFLAEFDGIVLGKQN